MNCASRSSEVCNAFYHFSIYSVVCWSPEMVTFVILALDFLSLTYLSQFVSSHLKDWGLRSLEAYFAGYYFLYLHCSLLLYRDGHNHHPRIAIFFKLSFCSSLLTTSWILLCEAPKCVMLFTTFPSTVLSVGQQRWSHSVSSRLTFSPWHLCHSLFLATSRIVVYEVLKRILLVTTFFIYIVLCCSPEMVTAIILALQHF